jgi:hypothetical protein
LRDLDKAGCEGQDAIFVNETCSLRDIVKDWLKAAGRGSGKSRIESISKALVRFSYITVNVANIEVYEADLSSVSLFHPPQPYGVCCPR